MNKKILSAMLGMAMSLSMLTYGSYASRDLDNYIVRVSGRDLDSVISAIKSVSREAEIRYRYDRLITGLSIRICEEDVPKIQGLFGVSSVRRAAVYLMDKEEESGEDSEDESVAESQTPDIVETEYTGAGQVVAVLDCGFNVRDPHFVLSEAGKAAAAVDAAYVGEAELNASYANYVSEKIPFAYDYYNDDTDVTADYSHGMNIASLIGADGRDSEDGYNGLAPDCQLLLMKVFDDTGDFALEESILAALEDAYVLGADIVNLSFGSPCGDESGAPIDDSIIDAVNALCEKGVDVVCAAGNNGRSGDYSVYDDIYGINDPADFMVDNGTIASPASLPDVTAVGSYAAVGYYIPVITVGDGSELEYEDTCEDYFKESFIRHFDGEALEYVIIDGIGTEEDIALAGDLKGKLAVIMRGEITFTEKCANAAAAGAVGVIIINTEADETVKMDLTDAPIPAISVTGDGGELLIYSDKKAVYIALGKFSSEGERTSIEYNPSSSWGPTPELKLKPDLIAPGYHIGALGLDGGIEYSDGTSIAAAYISGAYALMGEKLYKEGIDTAGLKKTLLMNSAVTMVGDRDSSYSPASYSPRAQGAGIVDSKVITAALVADSIITPYVNLGDDLGRVFSMDVSVTNNSDADKRYLVYAEVLTDNIYDAEIDEEDLGYAAPLFIGSKAVGIPAAVRVGDDGSEINFQNEKYDGKNITVKAGSSLKFTVRVMLQDDLYERLMSEAPYGRFVDGFIYLDDLGTEGGAPLNSYSLPFMGYLGDWDSAPAFDPFIYDTDKSAYYGSYMFADIYYDGSYDSALVGGSAVYDTDFRDDLCVFSPNADESYDYVMMHLNMLRNVKDCRYTIYSPKGKVVYSVTNEEMMSKSYVTENGEFHTYDFYLWDGSAEDNEYYIYPDGVYNVVFEFFMYDGSVQTKTFDLRLDTKAPVILNKEVVEENGERKLILTVKDEFALDFIDIYCLASDSVSSDDPTGSVLDDEDEEETEEEEDMFGDLLDEYSIERDEDSGDSLYYFDSVVLHDDNGDLDDASEDYKFNDDGSVSVEFDISGIDISKLYIYVYDYALNRCVDMIRF